MPTRRVSGRPVLTAVLGALCIAFSAILVRLADVQPSTAAIFRCVYALPALGLLAYLERSRFGPRPRKAIWIGVAVGVLFALDLILWHHAIEAVGAGLATVIANTQVVLVALIAWVLMKERPNGNVLASIPIVLVGVVLLSGVIGDNAFGEDPVLGTFLGILTALAYSGFLLLLRHGGSDLRRPAGPLFDATLWGAVFSAVGGLALGEASFSFSWPAHGWLILLALSSQVVGWLLIMVSLPRLPAALTSVLLTIQPVGSVFLGMLILDESPSTLQLAGVALVVVGVVVATARKREPEPAPADAPTVPAEATAPSIS